MNGWLVSLPNVLSCVCTCGKTKGLSFSPFVGTQFSGIQHTHMVVLPSLPPSPELSNLPQRKLNPLNTNCLFPTPPHLAAPRLYVSMNLTSLGPSCKCRLTVFVSLYHLSLSIMSSGFIPVVVRAAFRSCLRLIISHCVYHNLFIHPSMYILDVSTFWIL